MYNECPGQLPPGLRVAVAQGSLNPMLMSQFQDPMNLTELGMPADTQDCIDNLTQHFPPPTTQLSSEGCFQDVETTRDMMNDFLRVLRMLERQDASHMSFWIMVTVALLLLGYRMRAQFDYASRAVRMGPAEEKAYARTHRMAAGVLEKEAWEDGDAELKMGFEM